MTAVAQEVEITNKRGLHARASAKFVNLASEIDAMIEVEKDGNRVCGTSIMGLMMLGAAMGDRVVIHVEGVGADQALERLVALVEERFGKSDVIARSAATKQSRGVELDCFASLAMTDATPGHRLFKRHRQAAPLLERQEGAAGRGPVPRRGAPHPHRGAGQRAAAGDRRLLG